MMVGKYTSEIKTTQHDLRLLKSLNWSKSVGKSLILSLGEKNCGRFGIFPATITIAFLLAENAEFEAKNSVQ